MEVPGDRPLLRIGELSRRLGVSDHVLRAWENRYGLLQPVRSPGGFRLYSEADQARVRRMQGYLAGGLSVLAATVPQSLEPFREELTSVAGRTPLAVAGAGRHGRTRHRGGRPADARRPGDRGRAGRQVMVNAAPPVLLAPAGALDDRATGCSSS
jgi:MerR HTH family regulatory protein